MAIARFLDRMSLALQACGLWLRYAAKFDPFLSLDSTPTPYTLAQSKERKGSNLAIWQPWEEDNRNCPNNDQGTGDDAFNAE